MQQSVPHIHIHIEIPEEVHRYTTLHYVEYKNTYQLQYKFQV